MSPEKEFAKGVMSALRLEQNPYLTSSVEEMLDRIDIDKYTLFIAYLGERKSDYERPIQSLARAVDEFYDAGLKAKVDALYSMHEEVYQKHYTEVHDIIRHKRIDISSISNADIKDIRGLIQSFDWEVVCDFCVNNSLTLGQFLNRVGARSIYYEKLYKPSIRKKIEDAYTDDFAKLLGVIPDRVSEMIHISLGGKYE